MSNRCSDDGCEGEFEYVTKVLYPQPFFQALAVVPSENLQRHVGTVGGPFNPTSVIYTLTSLRSSEFRVTLGYSGGLFYLNEGLTIISGNISSSQTITVTLSLNVSIANSLSTPQEILLAFDDLTNNVSIVKRHSFIPTICGNGICEISETCGRCSADCCPGNDNCGRALEITSGEYFGSTDGATSSSSLSGCGPDSPDVWFSFTSTSVGVLSVSTCGSEYDTVVGIYSNCKEPVVCNDDSSDCPNSLLSLAKANISSGYYLIRVAGSSVEDVGYFKLNMTFTSTSEDHMLSDAHHHSFMISLLTLSLIFTL